MPKLVLLPGMDGTGELFGNFVHALPEAVEAITGRYPTDSRISYPEFSDLMASITALSEPFVLMAESFPTPLAIQWAATHPPNLKGLVLCAGFATSPVRGMWRVACSLLTLALFGIPIPAFAIEQFLTGRGAPTALVAAVRTAMSSVPPNVLRARLRATLTCDVRAELGRIRVPVLLLQPKQDHLVSAFNLREMRRILPSATVEMFAGPHLLLQREPRATAEAVARFARDLT